MYTSVSSRSAAAYKRVGLETSLGTANPHQLVDMLFDGLLQAVGRRLQHQIEASYRPVVIAIPGGTPTASGEGRRHYIAELIRRAIGFHINFGSKQPERPSS